MIITGAKKGLAPIGAELSSREIPTKVEGSVPFGENEALREILLIYTAVADPEDKIALYGALSGKVLGISKQDIMEFRSKGGVLALNYAKELSDQSEAVQKVKEKLDMLKDLSREAQRLSPAALFSRIMDEFKVYEVVEADNLEVDESIITGEADAIIKHKDDSLISGSVIISGTGYAKVISINHT